jgi:hypothetical protein
MWSAHPAGALRPALAGSALAAPAGPGKIERVLRLLWLCARAPQATLLAALSAQCTQALERVADFVHRCLPAGPGK